jgi:hypothetical protein
MTEVRPEDVPADADPVCGSCKLPAVWRSDHWEHAEVADAVICDLLFGAIR